MTLLICDSVAYPDRLENYGSIARVGDKNPIWKVFYRKTRENQFSRAYLANLLNQAGGAVLWGRFKNRAYGDLDDWGAHTLLRQITIRPNTQTLYRIGLVEGGVEEFHPLCERPVTSRQKLRVS